MNAATPAIVVTTGVRLSRPCLRTQREHNSRRRPQFRGLPEIQAEPASQKAIQTQMNTDEECPWFIRMDRRPSATHNAQPRIERALIRIPRDEKCSDHLHSLVPHWAGAVCRYCAGAKGEVWDAKLAQSHAAACGFCISSAVSCTYGRYLNEQTVSAANEPGNGPRSASFQRVTGWRRAAEGRRGTVSDSRTGRSHRVFKVKGAVTDEYFESSNNERV